MALTATGEMRATIYHAINQERARQDDAWGEQNHDPIMWTAILTEEVGEAVKQALQAGYEPDRMHHLGCLQRELIQAAAVCVAAIESLNRNEFRNVDGVL